MTGARYGVAVAGLGYAGAQHVQAVLQCPRAKLMAVAAKPLARALQVAGEHGTAAADDFDEVLGVPGVDIVIIATPNDQHANQVVAAVQAGKHVLCEKPMVTTEQDCRRVIQAVESSGLKVGVGHVARFSPYFRKARDAWAAGALGEAIYVSGAYIHRARLPLKPWWKDTSPGSFAVLGGGYHPLDLMRWMLGEMREVAAADSSGTFLGLKGIQDTVAAHLRFERACLGHLFVSLGAVRPYSIDLCIYGSEGTLACERGVMHISTGTGAFAHLPVEYLEEHPYFLAELDDLIESIETGREPAVTVRDAAATVLACLAVVEAIASGRPQPVRRLE